MSQQQDLAQLLTWISSRSNNEKALIRNGINALLDLIDPALQHDPDENGEEAASTTGPHDAVVETQGLTSSYTVLPPAPPLLEQSYLHEADSDVSSFALSAALQGTIIPAEERDITRHRALAMDRLEGRDLGDPQSAIRTRAWVLEQGATTDGSQPMHCFISLLPSAPRTHRPLHHAQGLANLRQVAEEQQSSTKSSDALVAAHVDAQSYVTSPALTSSRVHANLIQHLQSRTVEAPVNMEEESHGPTQVAPAVASPVPMDFDKISRRATWRDRKTRAVRANIRKRYYEMKNAIVRR